MIVARVAHVPGMVLFVLGAIGVVAVLLMLLSMMRNHRRLIERHPHLATLLDDPRATRTTIEGRWKGYAVDLSADEIDDGGAATVTVSAWRDFPEVDMSIGLDEPEDWELQLPPGDGWTTLLERLRALGAKTVDGDDTSISIAGIPVDGASEPAIRGSLDVLVEMLRLLGAGTEDATSSSDDPPRPPGASQLPSPIA